MEPNTRKFNDFQTQLNSGDWEAMGKEVRGDLVEFLDGIEFLKKMVAKDRPFSKDRPKMEDGRVIVDMTEPHILEDMDFFRQPALHFQESGVYTNLYPNSHPQSEYYKYWQEEARRCREGLVRESDGEWIPGDYYFYLNYSPIYLSEFVEGEKEADRVFDLPRVYDGDYFYYHYVEQCRKAGMHGMTLKSRGKGFSFKGGSGCGKYFVLGKGSGKKAKGNKAFAIADEKEYLVKDGVLNKFIDIIDHCATHTPWPRVRKLKDSWNEMHWKMGYKDPESDKEMGTKNEVMGVTLKNDPQKARGKRGTYIIWEEVGKFPNVLSAWQIARPSVEDGDYAFGTMLAYGTGGTKGADFRGAEEFFYRPNGYNILALPNIFDKNSEGGNLCAFFFPEYLNRTGCYDENGNSDVIKAMVQLLVNRDKIKKGASDPNTLTQEKAERPVTPQEAILRFEGTLFPVHDLKEVLVNIEVNPQKFVAPHYIGRLVATKDGDVTWRPDATIDIVRDYPISNNKNKEGGVEIFEQPYKVSGETPSGLYIGGIDPIDDDESTTNSLFSCFILNTVTDRVVAEYTGRPSTAEAAYEISRRLLMYYNAQANYENDKKGLFAYFKNKRCLHLLADTPEIIRDMEMGRISTAGNKSKGCNSSKKLNAWARRLQADWLLEEAYKATADEDNLEMNLHKLRSVGYIKELIHWNPNVNADRVSAMGMLMVLREDRKNRVVDIAPDKKSDLANDKFFNRHFKQKDQFNQLLVHARTSRRRF